MQHAAHHERATRTGARLVHSCGFDSIPHDLGVQFTVERLPEGVPIVGIGADARAAREELVPRALHRRGLRERPQRAGIAFELLSAAPA